MFKKVLLLVNPKAGRSTERNGIAESLFNVVCALSEAGYLVDARMTKYRGHATEMAAQSAAYDLVICCGGDGTLNETVCGLMQCGEHKPRLGYLPAGTTNDFAATLHLPHQMSEAVQLAIQGKPNALDVGCFNDRYFVYVASFGAFTQTAYTVPQKLKNALGHTAYMLEAVRQLPSIHRAIKMEILADGERLDGEYLFGSISNSTSIAGVVKLSPEEVHLSDGMHELLLVRNPKNAIEIQALAAALLTRNYSHEGIVYRHVSHLEIRTTEEVPWTLDGEYAPGTQLVTIDNIHHAITLMA